MGANSLFLYTETMRDDARKGGGFMGTGRMALGAVGATAKRAGAVLLVLAAIALLCCMLVLCVRHEQEKRGVGAVESPMMPQTAFGMETAGHGRFSRELEFTCFGASGTGVVKTNVLWDDAWFFGDPATYNHELARASMAISALAYAESSYYQPSSDAPAYMEENLHLLGFDTVCTDSYRYRSAVVDEILDVFTNQADGVAYTLARKTVDDGKGRSRELIVVSVRGSYGSEWLSNFNLGEGEAEATAAALAQGGDNHSGFDTAAREIKAGLDEWRADAHGRGRDVAILVTGHSRGGAAAGLVAAMLDDEQAEAPAGAPRDKVFAYTFASPRTTVNPHDHEGRYRNIFNVVNPADIATRLPLACWGYDRYGVDVALPGAGDAGFEQEFAAMRGDFQDLTGVATPYDPTVRLKLDAVVDEISRKVPRSESLMTPKGVAATARACATRLDPLTVLQAHYPSVYIAWLQTLDW